MSEIDLRGATLDHCQLRYTDLRCPLLIGLCSHTNRSLLTLTHTFAYHSGADLRNASLASCSLHAVNLTGARLDNARLEHCTLTEATLDKAILTNSHWLACELMSISGPAPATRCLACAPFCLPPLLVSGLLASF